MHIAVVACKPPTPKVFHFHVCPQNEVVSIFLKPECFIAQVVTDGIQNPAPGPPTDSSPHHGQNKITLSALPRGLLNVPKIMEFIVLKKTGLNSTPTLLQVEEITIKFKITLLH